MVVVAVEVRCPTMGNLRVGISGFYGEDPDFVPQIGKGVRGEISSSEDLLNYLPDFCVLRTSSAVIEVEDVLSEGLETCMDWLRGLKNIRHNTLVLN